MMETASFIAGRLDTRFLERIHVTETNPTGEQAWIAALAAAAVTQHKRQSLRATASAGRDGGRGAESPWKLAWRPGRR
jgi:hypothetical protein